MKAGQYFIYYADDALIVGEISKRTIAADEMRVSLRKDAGATVYFTGGDDAVRPGWTDVQHRAVRNNA